MNITKKIKEIVICLFVVGLFSSCSTAAEKEAYQDINAKQAFELIQKENLLILDVRTPGEFLQGHIRDSVLIPVQVLNTEYTKILDFKDKPVFIYCRSGNRSVTASKILLDQGFKPIYNLKGGIKSWIQNGYSIEK